MADIVLTSALIGEQDAKLGQYNAIKVKVQINDGASRAYQWDPAMYARDCMNEIREKMVDRGDTSSTTDHGLYKVDPDPTKCYWLVASKTLRTQDIHNGDEFVFKSKKRPLKLQLLDGSVRSVMIDSSLVLNDLSEKVGDRLSIKNPEEYSFKTLAMGESEWLNPNLTLHEQGVGIEETLIFKKKYFFNDANIDTNDMATLNLLYEQIRDDVVESRLPITEHEAGDLAAIQCRVIYGIHEPAKHNPKTVDIKPFLPEEYRKNKNLVKDVLRNHQALGSVPVNEVKMRFVTYARKLPTYGITVWTVKELIRKNGRPTGKFRTVLLGVSRSNIHRLDPITKQNLEGSPMSITKLRRWAPSKDSFTIDYGDHSDVLYTVMTSEGEAIAALIAGYIDIILRQRRDRARDEDDDDVRAVVEEAPVAHKAMAVTRQKGAYRPITSTELPQAVTVSRPSAGSASTSRPASGSVEPLGRGRGGDLHAAAPERALEAAVPVKAVTRELEEAIAVIMAPKSADVAPIEDTDSKDPRKRLRNLQGARDILADVLGDLSEVTADAVAAAATTDPSQAKRHVLISSAKRIAELTTELNKAALTAAAFEGVVGDEATGEAVSEVGKKMTNFLRLANIATIALDSGDAEAANRDLLEAASAVALAIDGMKLAGGIGVAKGVKDKVKEDTEALSASCDKLRKAVETALETVTDKDKKKALDRASANVSDSTDQLVSAIALAGGDVTDDRVQARIDARSKEVKKNILSMLSLAELSGLDADDYGDLKAAAEALTKSLEDLVGNMGSIGEHVDRTAELVAAQLEVDRAVSDALAHDTKARAVGGAKVVAGAAGALLNLAQFEADVELDHGLKDALLEGIGRLAAAIAKIHAAESDKSLDLEAVRGLVEAVNDAARAIVVARQQNRALQRLAALAKTTAETSGALLVAINTMGDSRNLASKRSAVAATGPADAANSRLYEAAQVYQADSANVVYQKELLAAVKAVSPPTSKLVYSAKAAAPGCQEFGKEDELKEAADAVAKAMTALLEAHKSAQLVCWVLNVEEAQLRVAEAEKDLKEAEEKAGRNALVLPEFSLDQPGAQAQVTELLAGLGEAVSTLSSLMKNGSSEGFGNAAINAGEQVTMLASASILVATHAKDKESRLRALVTCGQVAEAVRELIAVAQHCMEKPSDASNKEACEDAMDNVEHMMSKLLESLPGVGDCVVARKEVLAAADGLDISSGAALLATSSESTAAADLEAALSAHTRSLAAALSKLVTAAGETPNDLGAAARALARLMPQLIETALMAAAAGSSDSTKSAVIGSVLATAQGVADALEAARQVGADPSDLEAPNQLAAKAAAVVSGLDELVATLAAAAPGLDSSELDAAATAVVAAKDRLALGALPSGAGSELNDALAALLALAGSLTDSINGLAATAATNPPGAGPSASQVASSLAEVVDKAALVAVLIPGASDGNGFNPDALLAGVPKVLEAIASLSVAGADVKKLVKGTTLVLTAATAVSQTAKDLAPKIVDPTVQAAVTTAADAIAATAAKVVSATKKAAASPGEKELAKVQSAAGNLQQAIQALIAAAKECASGASSGDPVAQALQAELLNSARQVASSVASLIGSAKVSAAAPKDAAAQSLVRSSTKQATAAVTALTTAAMSAAPGQKECEEALLDVANAIAALDSAVMAASVGDLKAAKNVTAEASRASLASSLKVVATNSKKLTSAVAKDDAGKLAKAASEIGDAMEALVVSVHQTAAASESESQREVLAAAQALANELIPLLRSAKAKDANGVAAAFVAVTAATQEAVRTLDSSAAAAAAPAKPAFEPSVSLAVISDAAGLLSGGARLEAGLTYGDYQDEVTQRARELAKTIAAINTATKRAPDTVGELTATMAAIFPKLCLATINAAEFSSTPDDLLGAARAVADAVSKLVGVVGGVVANPDDADGRRKFTALSSGEVAAAISALLQAAAAAPTSKRDAEDALAAVESLNNDLMATELMANTGQLARPSGNFAEYRDGIDAAARDMAIEIQALVEAAKGDAEGLANQTRKFPPIVSKLTLNIRDAAGTLNDTASQGELLGAARALADALSATIGDALALNASPADKDLSKALKKDVKVVAGAIGELMDTTSRVEAKATMGVRALDAAADSVRAAIATLTDGQPPTVVCTVEEAEGAARAMSRVTAKLLLVCKESQAEVASASEALAAAVVSVLAQCKAVANAPGVQSEARVAFLMSTKNLADLNLAIFATLLEAGGTTKNNKAAHKALMAKSKEIADAVAELVSASQFLSTNDSLDENDAAVITEKEMLSAAAAIEESASKLNTLRAPPVKNRQGTQMSFEEQMLEACKAIAGATQILVKAATLAQKDIVKTGKSTEGSKYHTDTTWSSGLISASQAVAAECDQLVRVAGGVLSGDQPILALTAASSGVKSATVHLITAAQVKGDPLAKSQQKLTTASRDVTSAISALTTSVSNKVESDRAKEEEAAAAAAGGDGGEEVGDSSEASVGSNAAAMEARLKLLKIQAELEKAQREVSSINSKKYKKKAAK